MVNPVGVLSIHDVMPETLKAVEEILAFCAQHGIPPMTLLVVPGRNWRLAQIKRLQALAGMGHELAAHGWCHHVDEVGGLYHRLHAALLSRNVAEHLALHEQGRLALMQRAYRWFASHDLPAPSLYVPPAWALGRMSDSSLSTLPFERIEILRGVLDVTTKRTHILPLVGFEADSRPRAMLLRTWNAGQLSIARRTRRPVRIGVHPGDFQLRLAHRLRSLLQEQLQFISYRDALNV